MDRPPMLNSAMRGTSKLYKFSLITTKSLSSIMPKSTRQNSIGTLSLKTTPLLTKNLTPLQTNTKISWLLILTTSSSSKTAIKCFQTGFPKKTFASFSKIFIASTGQLKDGKRLLFNSLKPDKQKSLKPFFLNSTSPSLGGNAELKKLMLLKLLHKNLFRSGLNFMLNSL